LDVTLLGHFFQPGITILQLLFFGTQLVVAGNLQQHAGVGTGDARKAKKSNRRPHHKYVQVMDWNGDLAQLAVVSPGHEKYVEAFLQMPSFFRFVMIRAGTPGNVLRLQKACSDNLIVPGPVFPSWEWSFLTCPAALTESTAETSNTSLVCNS